MSLNVSATCDMINNIELQGAGDQSLNATDYDPWCGGASYRARGEVVPENEPVRDISINQQLEIDSSDEEDMMQLASEDDSIPALAPPSPPSLELSDSEGSGSDSDSGLADEVIGNVTNLCRARSCQAVESGIVTETGPYIPVTLGFNSHLDEEDVWEDVLDEDGNPTGMERLSFRLNIVDGRT